MILEECLAKSKNSINNPISFTIRTLETNDIDTIIDTQTAVVEEVGIEQFSPVAKEKIAIRLPDNTSVGAFHNNELAAMVVDFLNPKNAAMYADKTLLPIKLEEGFRQYLYIVNPLYRGYGLTDKLFKHAMNQAESAKTTHIAATVAPDNIPSLKILLNNGMHIYFVGKIYGNSIRYITYRNLKKNQFLENIDSASWIALSDLQAQNLAISNGNIGVKIIKENNIYKIGFLPATKG